MKNVVISDMKDYVKKHGRLILLSIVITGLCFGLLACSGNIRIDTEELINHPGSTVGWLTIGRYSLAVLKRLLGLGTHSAIKSGLWFLLFFTAGANLLTFMFYHFSGKKEKYPYWVFLLLYGTSNIWSFQVYFSLQQAEVALAMLLLLLAAFLAMRACFCVRKWSVGNAARLLVSSGLLVLGLGAYQALAAYYIAVCVALFLVLMDDRCSAMQVVERAADAKRNDNSGEKSQPEEMDTNVDANVGAKVVANVDTNAGMRTAELVKKIVVLAVQFGISYLIYNWIARTWFLATESYMQDQKGWGRMSVGDCIHAILLTGKNTLLGYGPRNFSFFTAGAILAVVVVFFYWKRKYFSTRGQFVLYLLAMFGLLFSPFLMTLYMGEMLVTRSQFALPVAAAFLGMYGIEHLQERKAAVAERSVSRASTGEIAEAVQCGKREDGVSLASGKHRGILALVEAISIGLVLLTTVMQIGYNLRLSYTDDVRYTQDAAMTEQVLAALKEANAGEVPEVPVIFVGYHVPEYDRWCARTEMYGWSFYEWDYSVENPTGATHRIAGFIQADAGVRLNEQISDEMRTEAVELALDMPDFPADGAVCVTKDFVVVRLSAVQERTDLTWW